jgi:hypothetical protein
MPGTHRSRRGSCGSWPGVADLASGGLPSMGSDEAAQTTGQPAPVPRTAAHGRESAYPGHGEADPTRDGRTPAGGGRPSNLGLGGE